MPIDQLAATHFDVQLTSEQVAAFNTYSAALIEWNQHTNLTAIIEPEAIEIRHFLDSLSIAKSVKLFPKMKIIDIGAGAGFPGLPLAIAFPQVHVTLLEATAKKVKFIQHVIDTLKLANARTLHGRAEELGQDFDHRNKYDLVLARAVARLPALLEYMLPLNKVGGYSIAMKGVTAHDEANSAAKALGILGGVLDNIEKIDMPAVEKPHYLVKMKKVARTPSSYPRRAGIPTREPLG